MEAKGNPKEAGRTYASPAEFKDSPGAVPTNAYYDVYKEMAAAGQYKREVLVIQGDCVLDDHFGSGYDSETPTGDDDIETLFDSDLLS